MFERESCSAGFTFSLFIIYLTLVNRTTNTLKCQILNLKKDK